MDKFLRLVKAIGIAVVALFIVVVGMCLLAWTKGLLAVLILFGVLVWAIYSQLTYRAKTMRKEDRKWGI